jgi:hypothetical protein
MQLLPPQRHRQGAGVAVDFFKTRLFLRVVRVHSDWPVTNKPLLLTLLPASRHGGTPFRV